MKTLILPLFLLIFTQTASATFYESSGIITSNINSGDSITLNYYLKSETGSTIKINISGEISNYIKYPKKINLEPNTLTSIPLKISIPSNYQNTTISGIVYNTANNLQLSQKILININPKNTGIPQPEPFHTKFWSIIGIFDMLIIIGLLWQHNKIQK